MQFENLSGLRAEILRGEPEPDLMLATVIVKVAFGIDGKGGLEQLPAEEIEILPEPVPTDLGLLPSDHVPYRPGVDVYVHAVAHAPQGRPTKAMTVELRLGELHRRLLVIGDRLWDRRGNASVPQAFVTMPITYAYAYGGTTTWCGQKLAHPDNPEGRGFVLDAAALAGTPLPNIEDPDDRITTWQQRPSPVGWAPISAQSGTHMRRTVEIVDIEKLEYRLRPQAFHAAHPDLVMSELEPGTRGAIAGVTPSRPFEFTTPSMALSLEVQLGERRFELTPALDTLGVFVPTQRMEATYRSSFRYPFVPEQERHTRLSLANPQPTPAGRR